MGIQRTTLWINGDLTGQAVGKPIRRSVWRARDDEAMDPAPDDVLDCPRCGGALDGPFYGPCTSCRDELRATLGGAARELASVAYEPKMNVTPNAIATKD